MYFIQHCSICRPSDSTVSEDAVTETRTVATLALTVWRSNHWATSHPLWARSHPLTGLDLIHHWAWSHHNELNISWSWLMSHDLGGCSPPWLRLSWGRWWWQWSSQASPPEWSAQSPTSPTGETPSGALKKLEFYFLSESIEWFIMDQTFSPSYDLAPPTPSPSTYRVSKLDRRHTCWRVRWEGVGEELNNTRARKPGHL